MYALYYCLQNEIKSSTAALIQLDNQRRFIMIVFESVRLSFLILTYMNNVAFLSPTEEALSVAQIKIYLPKSSSQLLIIYGFL